jgi:hypothetical protein
MGRLCLYDKYYENRKSDFKNETFEYTYLKDESQINEVFKGTYILYCNTSDHYYFNFILMNFFFWL